MEGSPPLSRSEAPTRNTEYSPAITAGFAVAGDLIVILLVGYVACLSVAGVHGLRSARYLAVFIPAAEVIQVTFGYFGLYNFHTLTNPAGHLWKIAAACCFSLPVFYLGMLSFSPSCSLTSCNAFILMLIAALYAERWIGYAIIDSLARRGLVTRNIVIIGSGPQCSHLLRTLREPHRPWTRILGIFDDRAEPMPIIQDFPWLGTIDSLIDFARLMRVDDIFLALPATTEANVKEVFERLRVLAVDVYLSPDFNCPSSVASSFAWQRDVYAFRLVSKPLDGWQAAIKTIEDKIVAACALLLLLPVFAVVALAIRLDSPGPVLFRQRRFGFNNQVIEVYKFRTMFNDQRDDDAERLTMKGDPRVTPLGRFLRRTSIDEFPQLLNVLKGDMSVIGPRPHAIKAKVGGRLYCEAVARYAERHKIRPGITGWAQVNGWRGDTDSDEHLRRRIEFDIYYMEHWSLFFDIRIMLGTLMVMLSGKGAC